jgi:peptidoglycan/LPS O-acetylase OafA/YrhL
MFKDNFRLNLIKTKGNVSSTFDLIRAIAAFLVLLTHLRAGLFVTYNEIKEPNLFLKALYFITSLGHQSVVIFFVLSGYFISLSVLKYNYHKSWSWSDYLIDRFSRIYTVLIPALFFTLFLDNLGIYFFGYDYNYGHYYYNNQHSNLITFIGNIFNLQNIYVDTYGSNNPLWSLNYEFWYYILFPLIFITLSMKIKYMKKIIYLVIIFSILMLVGFEISLYFIIWLLGTAVLISPSINIKSLYCKIVLSSITIFLFLCAIYYSRLSSVGETPSVFDRFLGDFIVGITFSLIMYLILQYLSNEQKVQKGGSLRFSKFSRFFANFSFTLYLIHYPVIVFMMNFYTRLGGKQLQPSILNISILFLVAIIIMIFSYGFYLLSEAHTAKVRLLIKKAVKQSGREENRQMVS